MSDLSIAYRPADQLTDGELVERLSDRYQLEPTPTCPICGDPMTIGKIGGGEPTVWSCSGQEDDPHRPGYWKYKPGRSFCDEHFSKSRYVQRHHGDPSVMELINRFLARSEQP